MESRRPEVLLALNAIDGRAREALEQDAGDAGVHQSVADDEDVQEGFAFNVNYTVSMDCLASAVSSPNAPLNCIFQQASWSVHRWRGSCLESFLRFPMETCRFDADCTLCFHKRCSAIWRYQTFLNLAIFFRFKKIISKVFNLQERRCWISCFSTCELSNWHIGVVESAVSLASIEGDGGVNGGRGRRRRRFYCSFVFELTTGRGGSSRRPTLCSSMDAQAKDELPVFFSLIKLRRNTVAPNQAPIF